MLATLLALAARGADGQSVVEHVAPSSGAAAAGLAPGDVLVSWRTTARTPQRQGRFEHWSELERLDLLESAYGPIEVELVRRGKVTPLILPARQWLARSRPNVTTSQLTALEAALAELRNDPGASTRRIEELVAVATPDAESWMLVCLARARADAGDLRGAHDAYLLAAETTPAPFAAELLQRAADAIRRSGDNAGAEALLRRALEIWRADDPGGLGSSFASTALGSLAAAQFELAAAQEHYEEACDLRQRLVPGSWLVGLCLNNLGALAGRRNDLAVAEARLLESLAIQRALGMGAREVFSNLGIVARLRGDLERAEAYQRETIEIARAEQAPPLAIGSHLQNLGNVLAEAGDMAGALEAYGEALTIFQERASRGPAHAKLLLNRGIAKKIAGDLAGAEADLEEAGAMLGLETPTTPDEASIVQALAETALARRDLERAGRLAAAALDSHRRTRPDSSYEALAAASLARIRVEQGDSAGAESLYRRAIAALEAQQQRLGGGDRGLAAYRGKYAGIYQAYQDLLLRLGRVRESYELYERSRAQALRAMLGERDLALPRDLPPERARERRRLQLEIEGAYRELSRLAHDAPDDRRQSLRHRLESFHAELDRQSAELHGASSTLEALEAPPALAAAEIQRALPHDTVLLAYSVPTDSPYRFADRDTTLFVVTRASLEAHRLPLGAEELAAQVERWLELTTAPRQRAAHDAVTRALSEALLAPAAAELRGARRLLVVPDGPLHFVSFAALREPSEHRYLVETHALVHEVSGSVWALAPKRPGTSPQRSVIAFGDPAYDTSATARFRRDYGRLPSTRLEARAVGDVFGNRARVFLDTEATEDAALRELPGSQIAHFACHAAVDEKLPLDSALLLSPHAGRPGMLQAWEILEHVRLDADLVVLSACDTARGKVRSGEGAIGLVRSLRIAGARAVMASLWNVADESTAVLMARFYSHFVGGASVEEALRRAQLELLRAPVEVERDGARVSVDASAPRHWAPFVLFGRNDG